MPPSIACPPPMAPSRIAPRSAAAVVRLCLDWSAIMRAMWCCVTCAVSCAMTPASSDSLELASTRPSCRNTKPPGTANALMLWSLITKYWKSRPPSALCEASRCPTEFMYSLISGSSSSAFWSRSWCATIAPRRYSSVCERTAAAGLPMSGKIGPGGGGAQDRRRRRRVVGEGDAGRGEEGGKEGGQETAHDRSLTADGGHEFPQVYRGLQRRSAGRIQAYTYRM